MRNLENGQAKKNSDKSCRSLHVTIVLIVYLALCLAS